MDLRRVRVWEWLTGLAGAVLLVSLFLDWYGPVSGWQAFTVVDVFLALAGVSGVALVVLAATQRTAAVPQAWTAFIMVFALVAMILALLRLIDPPVSGLDREAGVWLGTAAAVALFFFNARSMGDTRFPRAMR